MTRADAPADTPADTRAQSAEEARARAPTASRARPLWKRVPEHGASWSIWFVVWVCRLFGRTIAGGFLWFVSVYYACFSSRTRRASREFLRRTGERGEFAQVVRHIWTFARVALDRMLFLTGKDQGFEVHLHGHELIMRACGKSDPTDTAASAIPHGGGAILLGAHLGSFEAMRAAATTHDVPVWMVADFSNAERINGLLELLAPSLLLRAIGVDPANPASMLRVKEVIERGELVAILADRNTERRDRSVAVPFLGKSAYFPAGPYVLAHVLGCPVLLVYGVFTPPSRYDLYCELLEAKVALPRRTRGQAIEALATRYAARLEARARAAPYNWFNFYDFWEEW